MARSGNQLTRSQQRVEPAKTGQHVLAKAGLGVAGLDIVGGQRGFCPFEETADLGAVVIGLALQIGFVPHIGFGVQQHLGDVGQPGQAPAVRRLRSGRPGWPEVGPPAQTRSGPRDRSESGKKRVGTPRRIPLISPSVCRVIDNRRPDLRRHPPVVAGQGVQHERRVLDRSGQRPDMVERPGRGVTPYKLIRPWLALRPTVPQKAAGMRIEPPVSVPSDPAHKPAATAAPDPLLDPARDYAPGSTDY